MDSKNGIDIFLRHSSMQCEHGCSFTSRNGIFQLIIPKEVLGDDYNNQISYSVRSEASTLCPGTNFYIHRINLPSFISVFTAPIKVKVTLTWIYIAPSRETSKALRHGSHSFTCKLHHACLYLVSVHQTALPLTCDSVRLIVAYYSFINHESAN